MNVSSRENIHCINYSILMGFPSSPEMQLLFFGLFSVAYVLTLMGNAAMACAVLWDQRLHTPGYILLGNFSLLEICYITTTVPNMLANFLSTSKAISFVSCFAQCYFFSFGCNVGFYLCTMAIDSLRNKEMKTALRKIFGTETPLAKHRSEDMVKQVPSQPTRGRCK
uniref:G-protein coupled receptors family 1 profile domain-containing protein n=1 Tax=Oryctolagus cuniculus TaxID=9986 RepID=A0A5F9D5F0_RABIT